MDELSSSTDSSESTSQGKSKGKGTSIFDIPAEVLEHALIHTHSPVDVARFAQTCRTARALVYGALDQHLWRNLYLTTPFDDPRKGDDLQAYPSLYPSTSSSMIPQASSSLASENSRGDVDWQGDLQDRIFASRIAPIFDEVDADKRIRALRILISVVEHALPAPTSGPIEPSLTLAWLQSVVENSTILRTVEEIHGDTDRSETELQLLARLQVYIGILPPSQTPTQVQDLLYTLTMRNASRCFVYDLDNYTADSSWGPFLPLDAPLGQSKCRVNWKHLRDLMVVMLMNIEDLEGRWPLSRPMRGLEATRAYSATAVRGRDPRDWAGVEGTWRRFVCFMDYRDLFAYNFSTSGNGPRDPEFFNADDFHEAIRLIELHFNITKVVEHLPTQNPSPTRNNSTNTNSSSTSEPHTRPRTRSASTSAANASASASASDDTEVFFNRPRRPTLHFVGKSKGGETNEARVRGSVQETPDGQIRWRLTSIYEGRTQWSSEGVQIGNAGSAAGVIGAWTGAHHDDGDPAGPFWLWKVEDNHPTYAPDDDE